MVLVFRPQQARYELKQVYPINFGLQYTQLAYFHITRFQIDSRDSGGR